MFRVRRFSDAHSVSEIGQIRILLPARGEKERASAPAKKAL
jgi:hypothetical protein